MIPPVEDSFYFVFRSWGQTTQPRSDWEGQEPKLSGRSQYLLRLIHTGNVIEVREQLASGLVDPNERFEDGHTMLLWAARTDKVAIVRLLLSMAAKLNVTLQDGTNALMLSAVHCQPEMAKFLLGAGIDPNKQDGAGLSALHHCVDWVQTDFVIGNMEPDQSKIIRLISESSGDSNLKDKQGRTPLMLAAKFRHLPQLSALIAAGVDVSAKDLNGRTALTYCSFLGRESKFVMALQKAGVKPQLMDLLEFGEIDEAADLIEEPGAFKTLGEFDETTIMRAAELGDLSIAEALIEKGADVNHRDARGFTALHLALGEWPVRGMGGEKYWKGAGVSGNRAAIVQLLLKSGAAVDAVGGKSNYAGIRAEGETALVWATELNQTAIMTILLKAGADPKGKATSEDFSAQPPLVVASQIGSLEAMKILLDAGASADFGGALHNMYGGSQRGKVAPSPETRTAQVQLLLKSGANPNAGDDFKEGRGALLEAVFNRNVDSVKLLLKAGSELDRVVRSSGETPLMLAVRNGDIEIVKLLLAGGADRTKKNREGQTAGDIAESLGFAEIAKLIGR